MDWFHIILKLLQLLVTVTKLRTDLYLFFKYLNHPLIHFLFALPCPRKQTEEVNLL